MTNKEKIIIDTDIGDDIDDVLAITFALKSSELEVLGVTTVYKNVKLRARIAQKLLSVLKSEQIPVVLGAGKPLFNEVDMNEIPCQFADNMGEYVSCYNGEACDFIIDRIMRNPGEITVVLIGGFTNMALAIQKKPEIVNYIKRIVLMGGAYYVHINEYNIVCDPEAAKIVFNSGISIIGVGIDVTSKCKLEDTELAKIYDCKTPLTELLSELIGLYKQKHKEWPVYLHDPLALGIIIDETLTRMEEKLVDVELKGELTRGMTVNLSDGKWWAQENSHIKVCKEVERDRFVKMFLERICD